MPEREITTERGNKAITYTQEAIRVGQLPSGEHLSINKHEFVGDPKGPRVYIQANIHGPEVTGVPVVHNLIEKLKGQNELFGTVTLVPTANPMGLDLKIGGQNVGYTNLRRQNGTNWNRAPNYASEVISELGEDLVDQDFKKASPLFAKAYIEHAKSKLSDGLEQGTVTTEQILSNTLQQISFDHDVFIDLHTDGNNLEHVYAFPHSVDRAKDFGFKYIVEDELKYLGYFQDAFMVPYVDLWKSLGNDYPSKNLPKHAFTVELSGKYFDEQYVAAATENVWGFLGNTGVINGSNNTIPEQFLVQGESLIRYTAPRGGIVLPIHHPGETVREEQTIANVQEVTTGIKWPIRATRSGDVYTYPINQTVDMGEAVVGIFASPTKLFSREKPKE